MKQPNENVYIVNGLLNSPQTSLPPRALTLKEAISMTDEYKRPKITGVEILLRYEGEEDFEHEGYYNSIADAIAQLRLNYL